LSPKLLLIQIIGIIFFILSQVLPLGAQPLHLQPHSLELSSKKTITLNIPEGWDISIAAQSMKRPRFMAFSPDGRLFLGDMYNMDDTTLGHVYALGRFDAAQGRFNQRITYLSRQRNPNSMAFVKDAAGKDWLVLALTDHLVRYDFQTGDEAPSSAPETLATFPSYGLNYKYGGWHLTRTVLAGGNGKLYVSIGSSCDSCVEKPEEARACVLEMDLDGQNQRLFTAGLRNAVGLCWVEGKIMATDMGSDKLGDDLPLESVFELEDGQNYGWPFYYLSPEGYQADPRYSESQRPPGFLDKAPRPYWTYLAHAAPLGLEYFDDKAGPDLAGSFLVAFHGSSKKGLNHGYKVIRVKKGEEGEDFVTGFLEEGRVLGRPCGILKDGKGGFFLTDDFNGAVYYLRPSRVGTIQP